MWAQNRRIPIGHFYNRDLFCKMANEVKKLDKSLFSLLYSISQNLWGLRKFEM